MEQKCRIDKWLWAVRLFKTRTASADAVSSSRVKVNDTVVKASFLISIGKEITIRDGSMRKKYLVKGIIEKRVGAVIAQQYYEDITPEEEKQKILMQKNFPSAFREKGSGRPTKKERRDLDDWMQE